MSQRRRDMLLGAALTLLLGANLLCFGIANGIFCRPRDGWWLAWVTKTLIEVFAGVFVWFYVLVAAFYHRPSAPSVLLVRPRQRQVAVLYLCCDDLNIRAIESILEGCRGEGVRFFVHDDSVGDEARARVDQAILELSVTYGQPVTILRRDDRSGGKPAAINNAIRLLPDDTEFLLLFDSDSFVLQRDLVTSSLGYFNAPEVAVVQFRTVGHILAHDPWSYRELSASVTFYDAFVTIMDRYGWSPFLGHNAMLRLAAVRAVDGFTPGQLADDIDLSVRLRLGGYRIRYGRNILCGERHPTSYAGLRRRTQKWAYGCTQILVRWGGRVARCQLLSLSERITFFLTVGYYHLQLLLLAYLVVFYVLLPWQGTTPYTVGSLLASAVLILLLTFLPSLVFYAKSGQAKRWPGAVTLWALTYGSLDLVTMRAVARCLAGRPLIWIPTNTSTGAAGVLWLFPECCVGGLMLAVAACHMPVLLALPTTWLFAGKFLAAPLAQWWCATEELAPSDDLPGSHRERSSGGRNAEILAEDA